jgi:uncharacterized membrane protein
MSTATMPYPSELSTTKSRISSIDLMRGIVMVIMALDHTRDFFHQGAFVYNATDLTTTTPVLFFTRWITHYCAPTFVFLAGTSIYFNTQRKSSKDLSVFLFTRGLWLIFFDVVIWRFTFLFNFYYDVTFLQVIWAIGASMVFMAALIHLPFRVLLGLGLLITFGHNITSYFPLEMNQTGYIPWVLLEQGGFIPFDDQHAMIVAYPVLPWLGIMLLGYCLGKLYDKGVDPAKRQTMLMYLGFASIILFIVLRATNIYGDPALWSKQKDGLYTVMSFINCTKYPPSLLYTLMTLGPVLIIMSILDRKPLSILKPLEVFGRVPLFYYILHFLFLHAAALILMMATTGVSLSEIDFHVGKNFGGLSPESGYSLGWTYVAWISVVLLLYPLCVWYNRYKSTHKDWWLSYL